MQASGRNLHSPSSPGMPRSCFRPFRTTGDPAACLATTMSYAQWAGKTRTKGRLRLPWLGMRRSESTTRHGVLCNVRWYEYARSFGTSEPLSLGVLASRDSSGPAADAVLSQRFAAGEKAKPTPTDLPRDWLSLVRLSEESHHFCVTTMSLMPPLHSA